VAGKYSGFPPTTCGNDIKGIWLVKMDKVNRFAFDIAAEYFQVIAVIQNVLCHIAPVVLFKGEPPVMFL
jgi:hypothetical protein